MKKLMMLVLAIGLATILAACGNDSDSAADDNKNSDKKSETTQPASTDVKISDKEKVDSDKVVSQINGEKIKGAEYNSSYAQTKTLMSQYGQDVSDKEKVKEQTLNVLVQQELLKQDATEHGIKVTDDEVQKKFEAIKEKNGDQFAAVLDQYHLTEDSYKDQLAFEITLQKYMKQEFKAADVTDKEVQAYYDKLKEQSKDSKKIPELKKVKDQIKSQLKEQKQQQQLQAKIEKLKKNAEIKHMI